MKLTKTHITVLWIIAAILMLSLFLITTKKQRERTCTGITVIIENRGYGHVLDEKMVLNHLLKDGDKITGKGITEIDLISIKRRILQLPWVLDTEIYFTLHGVLKIRVEQRSVIARIFDRYGSSAYLGSDGMLMPVSAFSDEPILVINGEIHDTLGRNTGHNISEIKKRNTLAEVFKVASFISQDTFRRALISQIYVNSNHQIELIPVVDDHVIILGNADSLDYKFHKLMAFYKKGMIRTGWDTYNIINLKYGNQVICTNK